MPDVAEPDSDEGDSLEGAYPLVVGGGGSGHHLYAKQNGLDAEFQVAKRNGLHEGVRGTNARWYLLLWASLVAQLGRNLYAMQETWVRFLGWEDSLEKG